MYLLLVLGLKILCLALDHKDFHVYFSKGFIVLHYTCKSMTHPDLIFA